MAIYRDLHVFVQSWAEPVVYFTFHKIDFLPHTDVPYSVYDVMFDNVILPWANVGNFPYFKGLANKSCISRRSDLSSFT